MSETETSGAPPGPPVLKVFEPEESEPDDGPPDRSRGELDSVWFKLLADFVEERTPKQWQSCEEGVPVYPSLAPRLKQAQDMAIIAAFDAIRRLCEAVASPPDVPAPIVFLTAGRDQ